MGGMAARWLTRKTVLAGGFRWVTQRFPWCMLPVDDDDVEWLLFPSQTPLSVCLAHYMIDCKKTEAHNLHIFFFSWIPGSMTLVLVLSKTETAHKRHLCLPAPDRCISYVSTWSRIRSLLRQTKGLSWRENIIILPTLILLETFFIFQTNSSRDFWHHAKSTSQNFVSLSLPLF